jgi:hypothetical protein
MEKKNFFKFFFIKSKFRIKKFDFEKNGDYIWIQHERLHLANFFKKIEKNFF